MLTLVSTVILAGFLPCQLAVKEINSGATPKRHNSALPRNGNDKQHTRISMEYQVRQEEEREEETQETEVEPMRCTDAWPNLLCRDSIKIHGNELCKLDNKFGRFQCCESCAQAFGIKLDDEAKFIGADGFTYYPDCKKLSDAVTARGVSWTPWCLKWKNEKSKNNCQTPLFQQRCQRTCKIRCKNADEETMDQMEKPCGTYVDKICFG